MDLADLEEHIARQKTVTAGLVLVACPFESEDGGDVTESTVFQVLAADDHVFDVVDVRKVSSQHVEELPLIVWQRLRRQHFQQVSKIVVAVKTVSLCCIVVVSSIV